MRQVNNGFFDMYFLYQSMVMSSIPGWHIFWLQTVCTRPGDESKFTMLILQAYMGSKNPE